MERNTRAIRSMQNGSLDGRIVTSFPVKGQILEDYDEYDDIEDEAEDDSGSTGGGGVLRPSTEYFRVGDYPDLILPLKKAPYLELEVYGRNYSTVHVYWNNLIQRDSSYVLGAQQVLLRNPRGVLQDNDIITVKYWWSTGDGGGPGPPIVVDSYVMEGWFTGGGLYRRFGGFAGSGVKSGTVGANGGAIKTISTLYSHVGFFSHFGAALRLQKGMSINLNGVVDAAVLIRFPENANVSVFGYNSAGGTPGGITARKIECGLGGDVVGTIPGDVTSIGSGVLSGSPVPGSVTTHTGGEAVSFAQLADVEVDFDGNHQIIPIVMSDGWGSSEGSNSGCAGFGDPTFFDDTLYGLWTMHENEYDGTFGATIIVMRETSGDE